LRLALHDERRRMPPWDEANLSQDRLRRMNMKIKPLGDRIVVQRQESQGKTMGGIFLPDSAKDKPQRGKVLAVGPGKMLKDGSRRPLQVKEGDSIIFTTWAGDEFKDRKSDVILLMHEEDVLAVIEG